MPPARPSNLAAELPDVAPAVVYNGRCRVASGTLAPGGGLRVAGYVTDTALGAMPGAKALGPWRRACRPLGWSGRETRPLPPPEIRGVRPIPDSRRPLLADPLACPCPQTRRAEMHSNGGPRAVGASHLHATARRRGAAGQCHPLTLCWHSIPPRLPVRQEVPPLEGQALGTQSGMPRDDIGHGYVTAQQHGVAIWQRATVKHASHSARLVFLSDVIRHE